MENSTGKISPWLASPVTSPVRARHSAPMTTTNPMRVAMTTSSGEFNDPESSARQHRVGHRVDEHRLVAQHEKDPGYRAGDSRDDGQQHDGRDEWHVSSPLPVPPVRGAATPGSGSVTDAEKRASRRRTRRTARRRSPVRSAPGPCTRPGMSRQLRRPLPGSRRGRSWCACVAPTTELRPPA